MQDTKRALVAQRISITKSQTYKSHLIMLSAFVIGAYSAYWLWNNNQPKPFFKDYKTVAEINGCHFNVTEDTIDG